MLLLTNTTGAQRDRFTPKSALSATKVSIKFPVSHATKGLTAGRIVAMLTMVLSVFAHGLKATSAAAPLTR